MTLHVVTQSAVIASLLGEHQTQTQRDEAIKAEIARLEAINAKLRSNKPAKVKETAGTPKQYRNPLPAPICLALPEKGQHDAQAFLTAMLKAGKRTGYHMNAKGERIESSYTNPREVRGDQIRAIAAYTGYDSRGSFAAQDLAARTHANAELNGKMVMPGSKSEDQSAARSLEGYVHGMPDAIGTAVENLQAQERKVVETIIELERSKLPVMERAMKLGQEQARLQAIREQIRSYKV